MATVTIRPVGDGNYDGIWTLVGGTAGQAYTTIDETVADDTDYCTNNDTSSPYDRQSVTLEDMPAASAISSVVMFWRSRCASSTLSTVPFIRVSGTDTDKASPQIVTTTNTEYSWDITAEQSWTDTLINGLEIGWRRNATANNALRVTQAWVEITYTAAGGGSTQTVDLAGTLTPAGAAIKQANKNPAGTLTTAGAIAKGVSKSPAGTLTAAGTIAKQVGKAQAGTLTTAGALANLKAATRTLSGTLTTAGALTKSTAKSLAATLTSTGSLSKQTSRRLSGTLTTAGALTSIKAAVLALGGTLTTSGTMARLTSKGIGGTLGTAGTIARAISKGLAGALGLAGTVAPTLIEAGVEETPVVLPLSSTIAGTRPSSTIVGTHPSSIIAGTRPTSTTATP